MTNKKKPTKKQQFTICAKKVDSETSKPKKKPAINEFTDSERKAFEKQRKEAESTWSKIDRATIDRQCGTKEVWED